MEINPESLEHHIHLKLEQYTKVSGRVHSEMEMEHKHGQMEQVILDNGKIIKPTEMANLHM